MSYILSANERFYGKAETTEGQVVSIVGANSFKARSLEFEALQDYLVSPHKTGSRTFPGIVPGGRMSANWRLAGALVPSGVAGTAPDLGFLFAAAMGGAARNYAGGTTHAITPCTVTSIVFAAAQNLQVGDFIGFNGEIRAVVSIDAGSPGAATTVTVAPAFASAPGLGATITATVNYPLGTLLTSFSLFSYVDPSTALQRILAGCIAEELRLAVNGEFHELTASGFAYQLVDNITFVNPTAGLTSFPAEPALPVTNGVPLAGHYGQVAFGSTPSSFATLASGSVRLRNNSVPRREFGSQILTGHSEGARDVGADFEIYELDDANTLALYTAAKARTAVKVFFQLGAAAGKLFGAYLPAMVPVRPRRDEGEMHMRWNFTGSRAQGSGANTELYIAFG